MWNVPNKLIFPAIVVLTAILPLAGCSDGGAADARALLASADSALAAGNHRQALELLDTLGARHRDQTEIRRQALGVRARAMEALAIDSIEIVSVQLLEADAAMERLAPRMQHIPGPAEGVQGFWVPSGTDPNIMGSTALQGRVDDEGLFYIAVNVQRPGASVTSLRISDGPDAYTSATLPGERVLPTANGAVASFSPEAIAGLAPWLESHPGAREIEIAGSGRPATVRLTPALRGELLLCAQYSEARQNLRMAQIRREKYERMLAAARYQIANLATEPDHE